MTVIIDGGAGITYPDTVQQTRALTITSGVPTFYAARAWAVFDGTSGSILSSVNVASTAYYGTGNYNITFTTPMANSNYAVVFSAYSGTYAVVCTLSSAPTTSGFSMLVTRLSPNAGTAATADFSSSRISFAVFA